VPSFDVTVALLTKPMNRIVTNFNGSNVSESVIVPLKSTVF
jgi:hypothetical protein